MKSVFRLFDDRTYSNDIAIVFTKLPFIMNEFVRPAALPPNTHFQISVRPPAKALVSGKYSMIYIQTELLHIVYMI